MMLQIEFWQLLAIAGGLTTTVVGAVWSVVKVVNGKDREHVDEQFRLLRDALAVGEEAWKQRLAELRSHQDQQVMALARDLRQLENRQLEMRAELPEKYVRREDATRDITTLYAKIDAVMERLNGVAEKVSAGGR